MSGERRVTHLTGGPERLETARLVLTRPVAADLPDLAALFGDPRVGWMGGEATRVMFDRWVAHWTRSLWGMWVARDARTGELAGRGGPELSLNAGEPCVELGWVVAPQRWSEGLGTEIGRASIDMVRDVLGVGEVVAKTLPDNHASRRVMEKLGLRFERELDHRGLPHVLYRGSTTPGPAAAPGA